MEVPLRRLPRIRLHSFITVIKNWKSLFSAYEKVILAFCFLLIVFCSWKWAEASGTGEMAPAKGGSFIEGVVATSVDNIDLGRLVKAGLVSYDETGAITPDLAKSWTIADDKLSYQFQLQDKISSVDLSNILVKNPSYLLGATFSAPSENVLAIQLTKQDPNLLSEVSKPLFPYGPYQISKKKKSEIRLVVNKSYHLEKPYIEKFTVRIYSSKDELAKAAKKGSVTGALGLDEAPQNWQTSKITLSKKHILFINSAKTYLKSLKVRDQLLNGQKPDSIKTLDILEVNGEGIDQDYEDFKKKLTDAGIELKIRKIKFKDAVLSDLPKRNYDLLYLLVDDGLSKDPYKFWNSSQRTGDGQNFAELANADLDKLTEQYREASDDKKGEILAKINEEVASERVAVEYKHLEQNYYVSNKIKGFKVDTMCSCEGDRFNEVTKWYISEKKKR